MLANSTDVSMHFGSLEEFTCLMQGQLVGSSMEKDIRDSFAVFDSDSINVKHLKLMSKVVLVDNTRI